MLPVVLRGAATFAGETMDANERGVSLGEAAKGALKPALHAAVQAVSEGFQGGVGKKEALDTQEEPRTSSKHKSSKHKSSKRRTGKHKKSKHRSERGSATQKGKGRKKTSAKRVYKGKRSAVGIQFGGKSAANKTGKAKSRKRPNTSKANTNF